MWESGCGTGGAPFGLATAAGESRVGEGGGGENDGCGGVVVNGAGGCGVF